MIECSSCGEQRNELTPVKSKLRPSQELNMCNQCINLKREPRWLIIIVAQSGLEGQARAVPYVRNRRYVGKEISWADIL